MYYHEELIYTFTDAVTGRHYHLIAYYGTPERKAKSQPDGFKLAMTQWDNRDAGPSRSLGSNRKEAVKSYLKTIEELAA